MANIYINTLKISENGKNIMKLATDLNDVLISLYNRINLMPVSTGEWVGSNSKEFVRILNKEKTQYFKIKESLYQYGKVLVDSANLIEKKVKISENGID